MWNAVYAAALGATWAIADHALRAMLALARDGVTVDTAARRKLPKVSGAVAVLPLHGVISQRASIWSDVFGGTSTEQFGATFSRAITDDRISAVIIDVDSPGGTVAGVQEVSDMVYQGSQLKPVAALANSQAASAAYWIASQVGHGKQAFAAAPGADVGSIGVFRMHEDMSAALEQDGIKVTMIGVPRYKTEGSPFEPLSKEALEHHRAQVQATYDSFVEAVARGRNVAKSVVRSGFGEGRTFGAQKAAELGMVDRVATMAQLLGELGGTPEGSRMRASELSVMEDELCHLWDVGEQKAIVDLVAIREARMEIMWKK